MLSLRFRMFPGLCMFYVIHALCDAILVLQIFICFFFFLSLPRSLSICLLGVVLPSIICLFRL
jgi:hypothetical protein